MTVLHRARCAATDPSPRPADGGSMMPLAAALRTLGADPLRESLAGDDHPLDKHRTAVCEPGPAEVFHGWVGVAV